MYEKLRQRIMDAAGEPQARSVLFGVAFLESSFFPIPPDTLLAPMVLRRPQTWLSLSLLCTVASVLGGVFGYAIGYFLVDTVGAWLVQSYGLADGVEKFQALFLHYGALIILLKGLTPIPYKLVTIASGIAHFPLLTFIGLSLVTRAARFIAMAALVRFLTPKGRLYVERHLLWFMLGFLVVAGVGSAVALKFF